MQSSEIRGLTVFSIADGKEIGKVRELLINAETKSLDYLLVTIPSWYVAGAIPFDLIVGIGKDAVMVENMDSVKKLTDESTAIKLIESDINPIGTKVLTRRGVIIGKTIEYYVDENEGSIIGYEMEEQGTSKGIIPSMLVMTIGKEVLVVSEQVENQLLNSIEESKPVQDEEVSDNITIPDGEENDQSPVKSKAVEMYEQKQREYLLGRTVKKDLLDINGTMIISQGEVVTEEVIEKALQADLFKALMVSV
ncbi:MAG: PRC-barrel domain-containing protein [Bacillota bacterium]|nr:PRC-barrel domain-containing protein [Bacillota bacterium]